MTKGPHLTDRDVEILKYLAFGPAFSDDLQTRFFVRAGGLVSRQAFQRRMRRLTSHQYIGCLQPRRMPGKSPGTHKPVYAIAEGGIHALLAESAMPIDRIRPVRLDPRSLFHEIILTRLIRKIYEGDRRHYQVVRLYDHNMLAKQFHKARMKRIPDLRFTVRLTNGSHFTFLVEVDAGTTHAPEFLQKLIAFLQINKYLAPVNSKEPVGILVVCHTSDRMATLQRAVLESQITARVALKFLFNTILNIDNSLGLYNPWYRADGAKIEMIFKGLNRQ